MLTGITTQSLNQKYVAKDIMKLISFKVLEHSFMDYYIHVVNHTSNVESYNILGKPWDFPTDVAANS